MTTNPELDLYLVLGVERDASPAEIDEAYERARAEGELNLGDGGIGGARASDVERAYAVLRDPLGRSEYDQLLD